MDFTLRPAQRDGASGEPVLLSVNVGMPQDVAWQGKTVHTGIWKQSSPGPVMARRLNLDGDGQGDLAGHGGEQRAVLVYQIDSYRHWAEHFGRDDFTYGHFGENLTVDGLADDEVCIGDRYRMGEAEFEVTQPRVTCYRVGIRLGVPEMPALLVSHRRPGFYMRVITEGRIEAGNRIVRTRRGPHALTVAEIDALLYLPNRDLAKLQQAVDIPALSPGWQGSFRDLLAEVDGRGAAAVPVVGTEPSRPAPAWTAFRPLLVDRIVQENASVASLYLVAADGPALPPATPGQYVTLRIFGAGEPAPVRSYSLSAAAEAGTYRISVKREPQGIASTYLTTGIQPGAIVDVAAPRGTFVLLQGTAPIVFVSAGIGVTPVLAMLQALVAQRSEREIWWIHGARSPAEQPLAAEAHELISALPRSHEHIFYSGKSVRISDVGFPAETGRLTQEKLAALGIPSDASAYVCGPESFMTGMRQALAEIGIGPTRIFTELFGALPSSNPGVTGQLPRTPHAPAGAPADGPLVTFARSGISTPFGNGQNSLLELADACDVPARWSCRTGVCHTCSTPLLSGEVEYAPEPLEPAVDGNVLICCSQPVTDVILDM
jgi:ferredoxin-NADP reductase/MOSC domain-containing protein YiiM